MYTLEQGQTILFQGDSVTDCGRDRQNGSDLGRGYALMAAAWTRALCPDVAPTFINRGISGNRTKDLVARWSTDCIDLTPDLVSIFIGINNTWRRYDSNDPTPVEQFEAEYRSILDRTRNELDAHIVLMEPYVLPYPDDRQAWREDLDPKIAVVHRLADEYGAQLLEMDRVFAEACARQAPAYWAADGVHPTPAGHALIAQTWIHRVLGK